MRDRDGWHATRTTARSALTLIGVVAIVAVVLEQLSIIGREGFGGWAASGISGADFILLLFIVPGMLCIGVALIIDVIGATIERREHQRRLAEDRARFLTSQRDTRSGDN